MIAVVASDEIFQNISQLNARNLLDIERISGNATHSIVKSIEASPKYTHALIDLAGVRASIDAALDLMERLRSTAPKVKIVAIAANVEPGSFILRDISSFGIEDIITEDGPALKKALQSVFVRDGLYHNSGPAPVEAEAPAPAAPAEDPTPILPPVEEPVPASVPAAAPALTSVERSEPEVAANREGSIFLDLWQRDSGNAKNGNITVMGTPGCGKSYNEQTPGRTVDDAITPPSQITRTEGRTLINKKPPASQLSKAVTIAVAGAGERIGTTTQALQLTHYLIAQGEDAALIQMATKNSLEEYLEIIENARIVDDELFTVNDVRIYKNGQGYTKAKKSHHYLVCDYGNFNTLPDVTAFLDKDIQIIVAGVLPWETQELEPRVFDVDDGSLLYIFSHVPPVDREEVLAQMQGSGDKTFFAAYAPDYWSYCGDDATYKAMTDLQREKKQESPRKGGLLGLFSG